MYIFAHVFTGALLGLLFWHLSGDRRVLLLCIIFSLLPDLIDKTLGMLIPALNSGRTIFHSLLVVIIAFVIALVLIRYRYMLLGVAAACSLFVHQIMDVMWQLPSTWYFPLFGPFQHPAMLYYAGSYFWLEISTPAEWVFFITSSVIIIGFAEVLAGRTLRVSVLTGYAVRYALIIILAGMGFVLAAAGLWGIGNTIIAPEYSAETNIMTGLVALAGSGALIEWHRMPLSTKTHQG